MTYFTKLKIAAVYQLCVVNDKSPEYTAQLIQDTCKISLDGVVAFTRLSKEEKEKLYSQVNEFTKLMSKLTE